MMTFRIGDKVRCSFAYEPSKVYEATIIPSNDTAKKDKIGYSDTKDASIDVQIVGKTKRSILCGTDTIEWIGEED